MRQPEEFIPGQPLYYATAMQMGGVATGLLVTSHMGRPTKIEGNPDHPGSLGASDYFHLASILTMYDPDRAQAVTNNGRISSWVAAQATLSGAREKAAIKNGDGLRILTETVTSPTLTAQIKALQKELPGAKWHQYEPCGRHNAYLGSMLAFRTSGEHVLPVRPGRRDRFAGCGFPFVRSGKSNIRPPIRRQAPRDDQRHARRSLRRIGRKATRKAPLRRVPISQPLTRRRPAARLTCRRKFRRKASRRMKPR